MATLPIDLTEQELADTCRRYRIAELSVFGSAVGGDFTEDSDLDLLYVVEPGARVSLFELTRLQRELSNAVGRKVDLVSKAWLRPEVRDEVLTQARVVYAA